MNKEYLISLTSIPRRLDKCIKILIDNLKKQNFKCNIIINIPKYYKKWGEYSFNNIFENDKSIIIYNPTKDYGPATKLIGALEYIKFTNNKDIKYIITVDDDWIFNNYNIFSILVKNSKKYQNCAITFGGVKLEHYPYKCKDGLKYNNIGRVHSPAGYLGVLYPIEKFKTNNIIFTYMNNLPNGIFNDDDVYFGIILSLMNIKLIAINSVINPIPISEAGISAVEEQVDMPRILNEMNLYQYAIKNNLLFLNNFTPNITTILVTNCRKNAPKDDIIINVIKSYNNLIPQLLYNLIIIFDGKEIKNNNLNIKCKDKCNNTAYDKYISNVKNKVSNIFSDKNKVIFIEMPERSCLTACIKKGVDECKTEFINLIQDDLVLIKSFNLNNCIDAIINNDNIDMIRYSPYNNNNETNDMDQLCKKIRNDIYKPFTNLTINYNNILYSRQNFYSDQNHISTKTFYNKYIFSNVPSNEFMEHILNCEVGNILPNTLWYIGDYSGGNFSKIFDGRHSN